MYILYIKMAYEIFILRIGVLRLKTAYKIRKNLTGWLEPAVRQKSAARRDLKEGIVGTVFGMKYR